MKRNWKLIVPMIAILAFALIPAFAATCGDKKAGHGCAAHGSNAGCALMKDAKFEVENLNDGVKITLTSENPDAVKGLQDHAARCSAKGGEGAMCMPVKGATVETANLTNGVEIHLTSDKPETVKALQEHAAKCSAHHASGKAGAGCPKMGHGAKSHGGFPQGAKVEVQDLPDGATITLTSDDPEVVKAIQAHVKGCAAKGEKAVK